MSKAYDKEFLIAVYLERFFPVATIESLAELERNARKLYNKVGRDEFRKWADVTPERIREYNAGL